MIPYNAFGAQIPPLPLIIFFLGKRFGYGPEGLEPPAGARIKKSKTYPLNSKKNNKGLEGGSFVLQEQNTGLSRYFD